MYIAIVPNRSSPPAILLREGYREGRKVKNRTLANLTHWPKAKIDALRSVLRNKPLVSPQAAFAIEESRPHGHVQAVLGTIRRLGLDTLIAPRPGRERSLVIAMIAEQLIHPTSKLATTRLWHTTTLAEELRVADADEDELYEAMDWLLARQERIEKKLAARHLGEGSHILYDVSSSYYEGRTCPLACFGNNRDGKKGKTIIIYGVLTDQEGRPIAAEVYPGNTGDPSTVPDQVDKLRRRFGLERVVLVGDRGMLTRTQIDTLRQYPGLGWISALRFEEIRTLADAEQVTPPLFDQRNLAEVASAESPGERLIACFNPFLCEERRRKRKELLAATDKELARIVREVARRTRTPLKKDEIGLKVGRVINHYKMAKHFELTIEDGLLRYTRRQDSIERETKLDGIYVIRTSEPADRLSAADTVRAYKQLTDVERLFRTIKGIDRLIRPIRHRSEMRVRAHILLSVLAYYVSRHMRQALAPLLFQDEELKDSRATRDPVAPAKPSPSVRAKKIFRRTSDGHPIHSFDTLMAELGTRCRNRCRVKSDPSGPTFVQMTEPNPVQARALKLLSLL